MVDIRVFDNATHDMLTFYYFQMRVYEQKEIYPVTQGKMEWLSGLRHHAV